jgi:hypothetical protein
MENDEVKFKKIKKRKILQTWQHKNRKTGLTSFIFCYPNGNYYYFTIVCFIKRCGLKKCVKENCCYERVYYNSLNDYILYKSFDDFDEAVINWHKVRDN